MVAEENKRKWKDSNSESSDSESQSSDGDDEKVQFLMGVVDMETTNDELFNF